ncbi:MAG: hypothetical protein P8N52_07635 [Crocinitomicaceae bacterium]|nr:hypothetical protein [Crocinitomicaceae bacterium]MDG1777564.1 hypothetical protein [Crocinitomicaceae bacterium]
MKSLTQSLIVSLVILLVTLNANAQLNANQVIQSNDQTDHFQYKDSSIYARGLNITKNQLLVGNSDGSIYAIDLKLKKSHLVFKQNNINEIRDIETSGNNTISMHSGKDGKLVLFNTDAETRILSLDIWKGVFLDGMDFFGNRGFMMGDPVNGVFKLFHTNDSGNSWQACKGTVSCVPGEAGFAASGTNVQLLNDSTYLFVSGGLKSRFFKSTDNGQQWTSTELPYVSGESTGAYSVHFINESIGVVVGGDYLAPESNNNTSFYTEDGGKTWLSTIRPVGGYRSCVLHHKGVYYACGRNGIDFSIDNGKHWSPLAKGSYFSLNATKNKLIATTRQGSIQCFELIKIQ